MVNMRTEKMLEQLSRVRPNSRQVVTWAWCLRIPQSNKILEASVEACKAVPGVTVTVIPEPISWYPNAVDPANGDPILIHPLRRWWWGLWYSGYECQIRGEAREIQDYLRLMRDMLHAD